MRHGIVLSLVNLHLRRPAVSGDLIAGLQRVADAGEGQEAGLASWAIEFFTPRLES